MNELTPIQDDVFQTIKTYQQKNKIMPTNKDLADIFMVNENAIVCHIQALVKKGWLARIPHISRGLVILEKYRFNGNVLKLTEIEYNAFKTVLNKIDLDKELLRMDRTFQRRLTAGKAVANPVMEALQTIGGKNNRQ